MIAHGLGATTRHFPKGQYSPRHYSETLTSRNSFPGAWGPPTGGFGRVNVRAFSFVFSFQPFWAMPVSSIAAVSFFQAKSPGRMWC
jgi:hypothetical protein